ncbi:MAG: type II secretion system protein [Methylococcales bacterium]|nr:type II secretion system protein [Methylococcales bacterium]
MKTNRFQQGFSLLEILVAFSILAFSLGIVLKIFSSSLRTATVAEDYTLAIEIAESLLAKTGTEKKLTLGEQSGDIEPHFKWKVNVSPITLAISPQLPEALAKQVVKVNVQVQWGAENHPRSLDLSTLKILPTHDDAEN